MMCIVGINKDGGWRGLNDGRQASITLHQLRWGVKPEAVTAGGELLARQCLFQLDQQRGAGENRDCSRPRGADKLMRCTAPQQCRDHCIRIKHQPHAGAHSDRL